MKQSNQIQTAVSALLVKDGSILLVKRAKEPSKGMWALPGGKQEFGEKLEEAIIREMKEETNLDIMDPKLLTCCEPIFKNEAGETITHFVIALFEVDKFSGQSQAGDDAEELIWADKQQQKTLKIAKSSKEVIERFA